jgi:hypothetical protein
VNLPSRNRALDLSFGASRTVAQPRQTRRSVLSPAARRLDVLVQVICARVLARSAYSQSARDRQLCVQVGGVAAIGASSAMKPASQPASSVVSTPASKSRNEATGVRGQTAKPSRAIDTDCPLWSDLAGQSGQVG